MLPEEARERAVPIGETRSPFLPRRGGQRRQPSTLSQAINESREKLIAIKYTMNIGAEYLVFERGRAVEHQFAFPLANELESMRYSWFARRDSMWIS